MPEPRLRIATRALIVDPDDRILLVQFRFPDRQVWAMPGGGVDPGETHEEALRRELHEEVGYGDVEIGPPIWTRTHFFWLNDDYDGQTETIYLVRVEDAAPRASLLSDEQLRAEFVVAKGWWTLSEMHETQAIFAPRRLPALTAAIVADGPPAAPIDVGV